MCSECSHAPSLPSPGRAEGDVRAPAAPRSARARRPRGERGPAAAAPRRPPRRAAHLAGHQRLDLLHDGPAAAPSALSGRARRRGTAQPCWAPPDRARARLPGSGSSGPAAPLQVPAARPAGRALELWFRACGWLRVRLGRVDFDVVRSEDKTRLCFWSVHVAEENFPVVSGYFGRYAQSASGLSAGDECSVVSPKQACVTLFSCIDSNF